MKHKLLLYAALLTIAGACSKEKPADPAGELYPVRFSINTLSASYEPITKAATAATGEIQSLAYFIYDSNGLKECKSYTAAEFAALDLTGVQIDLPAGNYKIIFAAGGNDSSEPLTIQKKTSLEGPEIGLIYADSREVFSGSASVNVATATEYSITLQRETGAIELNITDIANAPEGLTNIIVGGYFPGYLNPDTGELEKQSTSKSTSFTKAQLLAGGAYVSFFPKAVGAINIVAFAGSKEIGRAQVQAAVYKNQKTVITGQLFGASSGFSISIDTSWGADNEVTF